MNNIESSVRAEKLRLQIQLAERRGNRRPINLGTGEIVLVDADKFDDRLRSFRNGLYPNAHAASWKKAELYHGIRYIL